jgi:hypothetical protein
VGDAFRLDDPGLLERDGVCAEVIEEPDTAPEEERDDADLPRERGTKDLVEVAGFEPASSESSAGLLRAQPVRKFSGHRRSPAACGDPSLAVISRRATRPVPAVSRSQ